MNRNLCAIGIVLVVGGGIVAFIGNLERKVAAASSQAPEEITLERLIARGAEGNPNVVLTNFSLAQNYVYKTENGRWSNAWVPAVPSAGGAPVGPQGGALRALIFTINARGEGDLYQRCGQPRLRALVTNKIVSLGSEEKALLQQSYPGTDFSSCLIIQEGREPAGAAKVLLMLGGGILAAVAGLGMLGFELWRWQAARVPPPKVRKRRRRAEEDEEEEEDDAPRRRRKRVRDE